MKRILFILLFIIIFLYSLVCIFMYLKQEKFIFFPEKLNKNYKFNFDQKFEELKIFTEDSTQLNGLLFKASNSKGLIFYLHGNGGSLRTWGVPAKVYTDLYYDVLMIDYRGYGKSEGNISSQNQLFSDIQIAYDVMKKRYDEKNIIVLGYSIGSGIAAKIASTNTPKMLILQAPYFSFIDLMHYKYPFLPSFILKYKLETNNYIENLQKPVVIFHGDKDEVIYHESSIKLKQLFKIGDTLITLKGQTHNGITNNLIYQKEMARILKN